MLSYEDQVSMVLRQLNAATAEQCLQQREEGIYLLIVFVGGDGGMMLRTKSANCYAAGSFVQSYTRTTGRHVHMMMMVMLRKGRS